MKHVASTTVATLLTLTLVTACGDDSADKSAGKDTDANSSASSSATPSASSDQPEDALTDTNFGAPAKGARIKGAGYTYRIPASWTDITASAKGVQRSIDSAAGESVFTDGFRDTLTVNFDKAPGGTLADLEASVPGQLARTVKKLVVQPHVAIQGVEAIHHRGRVTKGTTKYFLDQFVTIDEDGRITIITFSFSLELAKKLRDKTVDSVLASWRWKG